ncbi:hypothetical protein U0070_021403 [Myodes glareolus]|uniref:Uncharacterized protein n=1 Tax=Myodes glareolus TaxID=447135 RepID=A0AAW0HQC0_MYOGA
MLKLVCPLRNLTVRAHTESNLKTKFIPFISGPLPKAEKAEDLDTAILPPSWTVQPTVQYEPSASHFLTW